MSKNIMNIKRQYDEYCSNGFMLVPSQSVVGLNWQFININNFNIFYSPSTKITTDNKMVMIIGNAYELKNNLRTDAVVEQISERLKNSFQDALEYVAYLAGRFLCFIFEGENYKVIPDSHCTMACFWSSSVTGVCGSHIQLFHDCFELKKNDKLSEIMSHPDYNSPAGKYSPACCTPLDTVFPLIANCYISWENGNFNHTRFYPFVSLQSKFGSLDKEDIYILFKENLTRHLKLAYTEMGDNYISLTNGLDSRSVLAAAKLAGLRYDTFTYTKFDENFPTLIEDVLGAAKLATYAGYPHFILNLNKLNYADKFYQMYKKTFKFQARFPSLAQTYYEQLPLNAHVLISTISETGTVFYADRAEQGAPINAAILAKKWSYTKISQHGFVLNAFQEYIDYTQFYNSNFLDFDFYDLFYWEHRNSKWGNLWYQECDLSHSVTLPFNARIINELMLCLPIELRRNKFLLKKMIEDADIPSDGGYFAS